MIYFDNAATTYPKPFRVGCAVSDAILKLGGNPGRGGHSMAIKAAQEVYNVRNLASELFGLEAPENVIFTQNCSHALNLVVYGLLQKGDRVVISDLEHNSVYRPLAWLEKQGMIELEIVETSLGDPWETLASFEKALQKKTTLVMCTHASNVTGTVLPIKAIGQLAHQRGSHFAVDGAQSAGILEINMKDMEIDYLCVPGHKGLYGPSGTGMLLCAGERLLEPMMKGGTGSLSAQQEMPDFYPDRLECGTLNLCGICGLGQGLRFVMNKGIKRLYAHDFALINQLYQFFVRCNGVELYTEEPRYGWASSVISFNLKGCSGEETAQLLAQKGFALRGGLHCAPLTHQKLGTIDRGTARIGVGAFNTSAEVQQLCETIKKLQDSV